MLMYMFGVEMKFKFLFINLYLPVENECLESGWYEGDSSTVFYNVPKLPNNEYNYLTFCFV